MARLVCGWGYDAFVSAGGFARRVDQSGDHPDGERHESGGDRFEGQGCDENETADHSDETDRPGPSARRRVAASVRQRW